MKKSIIAIVIILLMGLGIFLFFNRSQDTNQEQLILEKTLSISRNYTALRYKTDNVLINAEIYKDYKAWNNDMTDIIKNWEILEKDANNLEKLADNYLEDMLSFNFINTAHAYTNQEISDVFDKAPAGKKIKTLAKFLGVDAKKAFQILKQDQAQVQADAWNEAGDTFQTLESSATVIKDVCKVGVFVGTIAISGGTSAIAAGSTISQAAVVVAGADLVLEVTDDAAKIALGNKNKISSIAGDARKITEPAAAILMISSLPSNMVKGIDKLNAVTFGADQLNSSIQGGSVIGIKLLGTTEKKPKKSSEISILEKEEIDQWLNEQNKSSKTETIEEIENILGITKTIIEVNKNNEKEIQNSEKINDEKIDQKNPEKISIAEYNELNDQENFKSMKQIKEFFGEPDLNITNDDGRTVFIYLDVIEYKDGGSAGLRFTFYTLEDYKKIVEAFGGSWDEDEEEIWANSEGGLVALSEQRNTDTLKNQYGL